LPDIQNRDETVDLNSCLKLSLIDRSSAIFLTPCTGLPEKRIRVVARNGPAPPLSTLPHSYGKVQLIVRQTPTPISHNYAINPILARLHVGNLMRL
jgi:hypothetical protein